MNDQNKSYINWWNDLNVNRNWYELTNEWIWHFHCYLFSSLYFALSSIALFSVLRIRATLSSNFHFILLNISLLLLGVSRALCLCLDPYGSKRFFPLLFGKILWDIGFPCICSALALLQLGFVHQLKEVKFSSSIISNESYIFTAITIHFCFVIISDILLVLRNLFESINTSMNIIFVVWIAFICTVFLFRSSQILNTLANLKSIDLLKNKSKTDSFKKNSELQTQAMNTNNIKSDPNVQKEAQNDENASKPKIKITDENELTVSFASDNTPSQCNPTDSGQSSHSSSSLRRNECNSIYRQSPKFNKRNKYNQKYNSKTRKQFQHSSQTSRKELKNIKESNEAKEEVIEKAKQRVPFEQQIDICSQKYSNCNVFESLIKRIVILMAYGLLDSLLQLIAIIGSKGLFSEQHYHIITWFSFQTIHRIVELLLVFTTITITAQSVQNYIHEFRPNFRQRSIRQN